MRTTNIIRTSAIAAAAAIALPVSPTALAADTPGFEIDDKYLDVITDPTVGPWIIPTFDPVPFPQPCSQPWSLPHLCLPDYTAEIQPISPTRTTYNGQAASFICFDIANENLSSSRSMYSSIYDRNGEILAMSSFGADGPVTFSRATDDARRGAPHYWPYLDDAWIIAIPEGLDKGEDVSVCAHVAGHDRMDVVLTVNNHVGTDSLGTPLDDKARHPEVNRRNNTANYRW